MKIETLVNLISGELLNSPYISEVVSYTDNAEEVRRGSCFFSFGGDINKAVKNGAYAIISDKYERVTDKEIAWIKVDDLKSAIFDIVKYENMTTTVKFTDEITLDIIEKMNQSHEVIILKTLNDLLRGLNFPGAVLVTSREEFKNLFFSVERVKEKKIDLIQLTLFLSKFENTQINLPYVYKKNFSKALNFFIKEGLKYTLDFTLERFKPIFVDSEFRQVPYGSSEKVLITGIKSDEYFFDELNYFIQNTKHAKSVVINKKNRKLLKEGFNFALIVDTEIKLGEEELQKGLF